MTRAWATSTECQQGPDRTYWGPEHLVGERDACGVGFIADTTGKAGRGVVLDKALVALGCMEHRGACSADQDSGDGAGVMTAIPWDLLNIADGDRAHTGVGMAFLPQDPAEAQVAMRVIEASAKKKGFEFAGWREVPIKKEKLGPLARDAMPSIHQFFLRAPGITGDALERALYLFRRSLQVCFQEAGQVAVGQDTYLCSLSSRTIVYKGMVRSVVLREFYADLADPQYDTPWAIYHRRFSTNTMPRWPLAQPMRLLGHNGEINTLLGNINWARAHSSDLSQQCDFDKLVRPDNIQLLDSCDTQGAKDLEPVVDMAKSDSANLDSAFELLVRAGRDATEGLMVLVPEAYTSLPDLESRPALKAFYEYHGGIQEAWDGPALLVFSDGKMMGAKLDRNGLRPARYFVTEDGLVCMMSETGAVPIDEGKVKERGRLGPGDMIAVDLEKGVFLHHDEIQQEVSTRKPYQEWLARQSLAIPPQPFSQEAVMDQVADLPVQLTKFGWGLEDTEMIIADMASTGKESTYCMGDDIPLAVLSSRPHTLYNYFKQRFAQVTNPPIDPLREGTVMSLKVSLGRKGNVLEPNEDKARLLRLESPLLNSAELDLVMGAKAFPSRPLSTVYPLADGPQGLQAAVERLCQEAVKAVTEGAEILLLSDRLGSDLEGEMTYIPPLLATGAVHHRLIEEGLRMRASLVVETGQAWNTHQFACLIGYGASAIHPYLALQAVRDWHGEKKTQVQMESGLLPKLTREQALENYREANEAGLLKVMSKMGISLLESYMGAQIFEAIGIGPDLLQLGFRGTPSRVGGLSVPELAQEVSGFVAKALEMKDAEGSRKLENYGFYRYMVKGEYHHNSPQLSKLLHKAVDGKGDVSQYELFSKAVADRPPTTLRDMLDIKTDRKPIPLSEVESAEAIMRRFCTGGMSLGALSREAHETLAIAMNRIGGKSNSGEGGEDPIRFTPLSDVDEATGLSPRLPHLKGLKNGDIATSAIKQVASGRFGVTPEYLMSARQVEIKMAQGAKPGEGGQLPGKKIDEYIAGLRSSKPGVTLISPPPHHDIYSIEDLAQLIYDLHAINPKAPVSVKLVAEVGIGTIAAGVSKANADVIQISGHDGGTGASPLSSIKHAGSPWELGLAEVHRTLLDNGLRGRVLLRVDGGFKTGYDILQAALMGGEEYGFGTIAMVAAGCIMARICHTNNCPVGVATQREDLRAKFPGTPSDVVNYFAMVAEEVRGLLAEFGYKSLDEIIGRADLLQKRGGVALTKTKAVDLDFLTALPDTRTNRAWLQHEAVHSNGGMLDDDILKTVGKAIEQQAATTETIDIVNTDRAVGARLAGEIAKRYGNRGFKGELDLRFRGSAGQSFGAFNVAGMKVTLEGEANDYVGKAMNGGRLVIVPHPDFRARKDVAFPDQVIVGNTCLYGATGGSLFALGRAGERFAVRNSGAVAVVEGAGDHMCEYMTGGVVVSLGRVGKNVGAGMTGGLAYVYEDDAMAASSLPFAKLVNPEIVKTQRIQTKAGEAQLKGILTDYLEATGSSKAKAILDNWAAHVTKFVQVVPPAEANTAECKGESTSKASASASASAAA